MRDNMGRFYIDLDNEQLVDADGELGSIDFYDKMDFYELNEFLNKQEMEKLDYKRQLKNLKYKIRRLIDE